MQVSLTPEVVLQGYAIGVFPMANPFGQIEWYSPDPRCIFEYEQFHIPHGLRPVLRKRLFEVRINTQFEEVITACGQREEGTWISDEIRRLYIQLHQLGYAHSVESWRDGELAGGLYGVALGGAFFGESMFHRATDASKVALVALIAHLRQRGYVLIDTQWSTPHLKRFGAVEIRREEYLRRLAQAIRLDCHFTD